MDLREIFNGAMSPAKWRALGEHLTGGTVRGGVGVRVRTVGGKVIVSAKRPRGAAGGSASTACPFGEIITVDDGTFTSAIRGGALICGDQNFNVPYRGIALGSDGSWLIEISLSGIDPATDDDDEIFLPGVVTAAGTPTWGSVAYTGSENYTDTTNPSTPAGTGTLIIPIGILTVASGAATFTAVGCGKITVGQCAGILSHARG